MWLVLMKWLLAKGIDIWTSVESQLALKALSSIGCPILVAYMSSGNWLPLVAIEIKIIVVMIAIKTIPKRIMSRSQTQVCGISSALMFNAFNIDVSLIDSNKNPFKRNKHKLNAFLFSFTFVYLILFKALISLRKVRFYVWRQSIITTIIEIKIINIKSSWIDFYRTFKEESA